MSRERLAPVRKSGLASRLETWWQSVWRRRWLSMATAWLICLAGWAVIALWPTHFVASAVIHANLAVLMEQDVVAEQSEENPVSALHALLLSDRAIEDVKRQIALDETQVASLEGDLVLHSTVQPVFALTYGHHDPDVAKQVLETVLSSYRDQLNEASTAFDESAEALDKLIEDHELRIQFAEADLVAFKRDNANFLEAPEGESDEVTLLDNEVANLEQQLASTVALRDEIAAELAEAPALDAAATPPSKSPQEIEAERKTLEEELANLQVRYADSHPYVVAVLEAIDTLDSEAGRGGDVAGEEASLLADIDAADRQALAEEHASLIVEVSTLNSRLANKRGEIELLQTLTQTTTSVEAELAELEVGRQTLTEALVDLQRRRDELGEVKKGEARQEAFRLIKEPELPTAPTGPSRLMGLLAVLVVGAGIGAAAAVFCNRLRGVFENAWQLRRRFDVGVLGTISEVMTPAERKQLGHARLAFGLAGLALIGTFSGLAIAEMTNSLAPLGDHLRTQILG